MGLQETKHFGNNNTGYVDAYDDIQLIQYGGWSKGIGYYRKNPLAYSGCHIEWGYIIWKHGYYQGNPLAWMDGLHYLRQSIDFEFLLQMELLLPEAAFEHVIEVNVSYTQATSLRQQAYTSK